MHYLFYIVSIINYMEKFHKFIAASGMTFSGLNAHSILFIAMETFLAASIIIFKF